MIGATRLGTVELQGLIEGPVPPVPDGEDRLDSWVDFAHSQGVTFSIDVQGAAFSLIPETERLTAAPHDDFQEKVKQLLEQLLEAFPEHLRGRVFSTLRSVQYLPDTQIQTIYVITPSGVDMRSREAPWSGDKTIPFTMPNIPRAYWIGAGAVVVILIVSSFFIEWGRVLRFTTGTGFSLETIEVDASSLARYVECEKKSIQYDRLILSVKRTPDFPTDLTAYQDEERRIAAGSSLEELLVLRTLVGDGIVRIDYLAEDGKIVGSDTRRVRELLDKETMQLSLPLSRPTAAWHKLRLTY